MCLLSLAAAFACARSRFAPGGSDRAPASVADARRGFVVVGVRRRIVILALGLLGSVVVCMNEWAVVVLVLVIGGAMFELTEDATGVVMGHVIVIVGVNHWLVGVFVLLVAHDALLRGDALAGHRLLLHVKASVAAARATLPVRASQAAREGVA
jgi:hypothetical protein